MVRLSPVFKFENVKSALSVRWRCVLAMSGSGLLVMDVTLALIPLTLITEPLPVPWAIRRSPFNSILGIRLRFEVLERFSIQVLMSFNKMAPLLPVPVIALTFAPVPCVL